MIELFIQCSLANIYKYDITMTCATILFVLSTFLYIISNKLK